MTDVKELSFIDNGKIDVEALEVAFEQIKKDAIKSNNGTLAAGRRFRTSTVALGKAFKDMRSVSAI